MLSKPYRIWYIMILIRKEKDVSYDYESNALSAELGWHRTVNLFQSSRES